MTADTRRRIARHTANLGSMDPKVAINAERRLRRFGDKAVDALLDVAEDPDPQVRFRAAWTLGKIGDRRARDVLLRLTRDADDRVAYDALIALGDLGDASVAPQLWELALGPRDERALYSAARSALIALGLLEWADGDPEKSDARSG